jgi:hypothetical protein
LSHSGLITYTAARPASPAHRPVTRPAHPSSLAGPAASRQRLPPHLGARGRPRIVCFAMADKEAEADKLMKKAMKEINPSLLDFRLKPDWEAAAPNFDRAAMLYKASGGGGWVIGALEQLCKRACGAHTRPHGPTHLHHALWRTP